MKRQSPNNTVKGSGLVTIRPAFVRLLNKNSNAQCARWTPTHAPIVAVFIRYQP